MPDGEVKKITDIRAGNTVLTFSDTGKVIEDKVLLSIPMTGKQGDNEGSFTKIRLSSNQEFEITPTHLVLITTRK
jgi:hypothetical protein